MASPLISIPSISFTAREYVRARLDGTDFQPGTSFNANISATSLTYGVAPFFLSTTSTPPSLWLGRYDLAMMLKAGLVSVNSNTLAVLSTAKDDMMLSTGIHQSMRLTPATYSGPIYMAVDFYLLQQSTSPDAEANFHAIDDAMYSTFNTSSAASVLPPGLTYNNELICQQGNMEYESQTWLQHIACAMVFYRIV